MLLRKCIVFIFSSLLMIGYAFAGQLDFYDTNGKMVTLSNLKGKWVVVNYWADWCGACIQEIPELNNFNENIKDKNIVFYGVDYDELSLDSLKSSIASVDIKFPVLTADPGFLWNLGSVEVIPTTFIINPEGRVAKVITGPNTERSLMNTINALQTTSASAK